MITALALAAILAFPVIIYLQIRVSSRERRELEDVLALASEYRESVRQLHLRLDRHEEEKPEHPFVGLESEVCRHFEIASKRVTESAKILSKVVSEADIFLIATDLGREFEITARTVTEPARILSELFSGRDLTLTAWPTGRVVYKKSIGPGWLEAPRPRDVYLSRHSWFLKSEDDGESADRRTRRAPSKLAADAG